MRIGIGAGHGGNDPGAVAFGNVERDLNRIVTPVMQNLLREAGHEVINLTVDKGYPYNINEPVSIANSHGCDLAIQVHFNAAGGTGPEVLHWNGDNWGRDLASQMAAGFASSVGLYNRGPKARGSELGFLAGTGMTALIIECGFVDAPNNQDVPAIINNLETFCRAGLAVLGVGPAVAPPPPPEPPVTPPAEPEELYRVRAEWGDAKSQLGAFKILENAKALCDQHAYMTYPYEVYNSKGEQVYP